MDIKVLWIDDQPNQAFIDKADKAHIYIEVCKNVDAGIDELVNTSNSYDAIILDANCISHNDGSTEPDISALGYALRKITEKQITHPWFVYSGGGFSGEESIDIIVRSYERPYDEKTWYKKPSEINELFSKIKQIVPESKIYKIKEKYSKIFSFYPNAKELVGIISYVEEKKFNDPSVFNLVRKELDWVMRELNTYGILALKFSGSNLNDCSRFLALPELNEYVPQYMKRQIHSCCTIANEGSHRLVTDKDVRTGVAPFLVNSTVFELLNILMWMHQLPTDDETRRKITNIAVNCLAKFKIEESSDNEEPQEPQYDEEFHVWHCGDTLIGIRHWDGGKIVLFDKKDNKSDNPKLVEKYPFYAKYKKI